VRGTLAAVALVLLGLGAALTAWWLRAAPGSPVTIDRIGDRVQTVRRGTLPVFAREGEVAGLYRFAADHPELLRWIPCTCGCGDLDHGSNRACYVKDERGDQVTFTSHAAT
jgi:hypothetical protein